MTNHQSKRWVQAPQTWETSTLVTKLHWIYDQLCRDSKSLCRIEIAYLGNQIWQQQNFFFENRMMQSIFVVKGKSWNEWWNIQNSSIDRIELNCLRSLFLFSSSCFKLFFAKYHTRIYSRCRQTPDNLKQWFSSATFNSIKLDEVTKDVTCNNTKGELSWEQLSSSEQNKLEQSDWETWIDFTLNSSASITLILIGLFFCFPFKWKQYELDNFLRFQCE